MDKEGIQEIIKKNPELMDKLFARGFLLTNGKVNPDEYPFYGIWQSMKLDRYQLLVSPKQSFNSISKGKTTILLVGHAYNPFSMVSDENEILTVLSEQYSKENIKEPSSPFWEIINELTGVFTIILIKGNAVTVIGDASGMQTVFYTIHKGNVYISSHTNMIGDILDLEWDPYVRRLKKYRFFKLLGNALPGNLTQFRSVKRLIPNHYVRVADRSVRVIRFYWPHTLEKPEVEIVDEVAGLMHSNMELISRKWEKPAVSLTGGCDSKTTLACSNGLYDRFRYFSYISSESEKVDAEAAEKICKALGLAHKTYVIPEVGIDQTEEVAEILNWNTGNIRYSHANDVRKRIVFADTVDFDVEVKSWASEIGRAYYSKRFNGRKDFGKMTPRKCTTLYKFFFHDRRLVKQTDKVFEKYIDRYFEQARENPVEWQEQFFWEFRVPSWNGLVITGEHRYSFDITIPYNNRRILELLLSASIDDRIADRVYKDIREKMNPAIDQTGIAVTNLKHTKRRERIENIYFLLHTNVPF